MKALSVELWGYPGSGKTSVAGRLRDEARLPVIRVQSLRASLARSPSRAIRAAADRRFLSALVPGRDAAARRRLASLWLRQACMVAGRSSPALLEEGLVHGLWRSLYYDPSAAGKSWWRRFADGLSGTVIVLDVEPATALARIREKPLVRGVNLELAGAPLGGEAWGRARHAYDTLLALLRNARAVDLVEIDAGARGVASIAAEVARRFDMATASK